MAGDWHAMAAAEADAKRRRASLPVGLSADARRTARRNVELSAGVHPATKQPLANNGETCGSCPHLVRRGHGSRDYFKCSLLPITAGAATDVRISWPACRSWGVPK